ncbi:hypothetical protein [Holophaga foetida]|nr:hypothetical protein [Holophaga foetida]
MNKPKQDTKKRVICLISALAYHNLRTPIPTATWVATDRNA